MVRSLAASLLFVAATAAAQELSYGPVEPGPRDHSFAAAVAPHGVLLAWSEIDRATKLSAIRTALFDFDLKLAGPVHTLPAPTKNVHATTPAVATDGEGFFVAWIERNRYTETAQLVAGAPVDRNGRPAGESRIFGAAVASSPALVWDGLTYRLYGDETYFITPDGTPGRDFGSAPRRVPFTTPEANGWVDWTYQPRRPGFPCFVFCGGIPLNPAPPSYTLEWVVVTPDWIRTGSHRELDYEAFAPAVAARDNDLVIAWSTPKGLSAIRVEDGVETAHFVLNDDRAKEITPSIAESLLVFHKDADVFGTVIRGIRFGPVFPISRSHEWDWLPRAYLAGENRYLVTWVREGEGPDVYLTGRFVTIEE
jgi:hypothetical protein